MTALATPTPTVTETIKQIVGNGNHQPTDQLRILFDETNSTACQLADAIRKKVFEWLPFPQVEPKIIKELIDDSEDIGTLEKGQKTFDTAWLVGNKAGTNYMGLEAQAMPSCRIQLQGQRLVAMASVNELQQFYKQRGIQDCIDMWKLMNGDAGSDCEVPDAWTMPSLCFEFVRTGDVVFCPAGTVIVEKAVESSVSLRHSRAFHRTMRFRDSGRFGTIKIKQLKLNSSI